MKGNRIFIKQWIPPAFLKILRNIGGSVTWSGNYSSWAEARAASTGYDSHVILEKVQASLLKVKKGEVAYERDSVLFDEIRYSWPLLAGLMWIAALGEGKLNVLDFGGSLGSSYYQNRKFLETLPLVHWSIVEQKAFVKAGRKCFENDALKFYSNIDSCLKQRSPNSIILSGVIQYIEDPYALLERLTSLRFEYILFDRTPFITGKRDRLTIQKVSPEIYQASYPCWFFAKDRFRAFFYDNYETVAEFEGLDIANITSTFDGCILRRR